MNNWKFVLMFCIVLYCFGCGGVSDNTIDLGYGYTLVRESNNYNYIVGHRVYIIIDSMKKNEELVILHQSSTKDMYTRSMRDLLSTKVLLYENKKVNVENHKKQKATILIDPEYTFSKSDSLIIKQIMHKGYNGLRNSETDWNILDSVIDSLLQNDNYYKDILNRKAYYWIIINNKFNGPYDYEECYNFTKDKGSIMTNLLPIQEIGDNF